MLIVDDDADIREILAEILVEVGFEVLTAANGREALALVRDTGLRPSLIVLDLMMPIMDGHAFRAAQRDMDDAADIPVIVLSAAHNVQTRASNMGAAAIFPKPFDLGTLLDAVARTVREPPPAQAAS